MLSGTVNAVNYRGFKYDLQQTIHTLSGLFKDTERAEGKAGSVTDL